MKKQIKKEEKEQKNNNENNNIKQNKQDFVTNNKSSLVNEFYPFIKVQTTSNKLANIFNSNL